MIVTAIVTHTLPASIGREAYKALFEAIAPGSAQFPVSYASSSSGPEAVWPAASIWDGL